MAPRVPARDNVTDAVAAALLLLSLALWWNADTRPTDNLGVLTVTLLSLVSLTFHYLWRAQALPFAWEARTAGIARAVANLPYVVTVLIAVVIDLVGSLSGSSRLPAGVGAGAVVGLAGAVLAAVPRATEVEADRAEVLTRLLRGALLGLAVAAAVLQLVGVLAPYVHRSPVWYLDPSLMPWYVALGAGLGVVAAVPATLLARGSDAWRPVVIVTGAVSVGWPLVAAQGLVASTLGVSLALVVPPAAAAVASAPAAWRTGPDRRSYGLAVARAALAFAVVVAAVVAATTLTWIGAGRLGAAPVAVLALTVGAGSAAAVGFSTRSARLRAVCVALVATLGLAALVVSAVADDDAGASWIDALLALGLPGLAAWALFMPAAGRSLASRVDFSGDSIDL